MKTPFLLCSLVVATLFSACGGAVDSTGTSSSGGRGPTPAPGSTAPAPPSGLVGPPTPVPAEQTPTTWNATAHGCANFTVYTEDQSGRRFLVVTAVKKELGLENLGDTATVDLATKVSGPSTEVYVDTYARVPTEQGYCSDIRDFYEPDQAKAIGGLATFTIAGVGREGGAYAVTVSLRGVTVRAATGALEKIPDVTYTMVNVGWLPG